jgi:RimJ/RimL family protein N-acetyltransferase
MNIKSKMEIVTRRFLLRDFVDSDRLPFLKYQADPRNLTFYDPEQSALLNRGMTTPSCQYQKFDEYRL